MHLLQNFALACGAKIDSKPVINTKFYPTPEKYIVLGATGGMPGKAYWRFQEIINIILPELQKNNIEIIQLGNKEEQQFSGIKRLNGETSFSQSAHIIKNALMVLSVDTVFVHLAAAFNVPLLALYSISSPLECGPFFGDKSKQILLTPKFSEGHTFSYDPNDMSLPANSILIEDVVDGISKILGLEFEKIKTLYIGNQFAHSVIEFVPIPNVGLIPPQLFPNLVPLIRLDLPGGDEQTARQQISVRKSTVLCDKPLDLVALTPLKPNLEQIVYIITKEYSLDFVKALYGFGVPFALATDLPPEEVDMIRLDCAEYGIIFPRTKGKRPDMTITDRTLYKTNKFLFANGKTFLSTEHFRKNKHSDGSNKDKIIDNDKFWEDSEFMFVYESEKS